MQVVQLTFRLDDAEAQRLNSANHDVLGMFKHKVVLFRVQLLGPDRQFKAQLRACRL